MMTDFGSKWQLRMLEILKKGHTSPWVFHKLPGRMIFTIENLRKLCIPTQKHAAIYYFGQGLSAADGHAL